MATKPSSIPNWVTSNLPTGPTDGVSGQDAIITPSGGKIASGFIRLERPPRQDLNWMQNLNGLWIEWLDQQTDLNDIHRLGDGSDHADVAANTAASALNTTHRNTVTGNPHDVKATQITDFDTEVSNNSDVALNTTHRSSDGTSHANVVLNDSHRAGDGSDHADVAANTAAIAALVAPRDWLTDEQTIMNDITSFGGLQSKNHTVTMDGASGRS